MSTKWGEDETLALLELWADPEIQRKLKFTYHNKDLWDGVATRLAAIGFFRTGFQCKIKVGMLKKEYQKFLLSPRAKYQTEKYSNMSKYWEVIRRVQRENKTNVAVHQFKRSSSTLNHNNNNINNHHQQHQLHLINASQQASTIMQQQDNSPGDVNIPATSFGPSDGLAAIGGDSPLPIASGPSASAAFLASIQQHLQAAQHVGAAAAAHAGAPTSAMNGLVNDAAAASAASASAAAAASAMMFDNHFALPPPPWMLPYALNLDDSQTSGTAGNGGQSSSGSGGGSGHNSVTPKHEQTSNSDTEEADQDPAELSIAESPNGPILNGGPDGPLGESSRVTPSALLGDSGGSTRSDGTPRIERIEAVNGGPDESRMENGIGGNSVASAESGIRNSSGHHSPGAETPEADASNSFRHLIGGSSGGQRNHPLRSGRSHHHNLRGGARSTGGHGHGQNGQNCGHNGASTSINSHTGDNANPANNGAVNNAGTSTSNYDLFATTPLNDNLPPFGFVPPGAATGLTPSQSQAMNLQIVEALTKAFVEGQKVAERQFMEYDVRRRQEEREKEHRWLQIVLEHQRKREEALITLVAGFATATGAGASTSRSDLLESGSGSGLEDLGQMPADADAESGLPAASSSQESQNME